MRAFSPLLFAPPAGFPLAGVVAFAGSRHGTPYHPAPLVAAVLGAGGVVRVGCARGVDQSVVRAAAGRAVVIRAAQPTAADLAARTRAVVAGASALAVFPPSGGALALGPGSALALSVALELALPVWVAGKARPLGLAWSPLELVGCPGWLCLPAHTQPALF